MYNSEVSQQDVTMGLNKTIILTVFGKQTKLFRRIKLTEQIYTELKELGGEDVYSYFKDLFKYSMLPKLTADQEIDATKIEHFPGNMSDEILEEHEDFNHFTTLLRAFNSHLYTTWDKKDIGIFTFSEDMDKWIHLTAVTVQEFVNSDDPKKILRVSIKLTEDHLLYYNLQKYHNKALGSLQKFVKLFNKLRPSSSDTERQLKRKVSNVYAKVIGPRLLHGMPSKNDFYPREEEEEVPKRKKRKVEED